MAGHEGLELRNAVANYPFETLRGFLGSEPNSGHGDHSRLSCSAGVRSSGLGSVRIFSKRSARTSAICGVAEKHDGRDLFRSDDDPPSGKAAIPLLSLRWTSRAKRACVVSTDAEPDRLAPLTPASADGLRGVWVVAARCCASSPARLLRQR